MINVRLRSQFHRMVLVGCAAAMGSAMLGLAATRHAEAGLTASAPEPSPVPKRWQLDLELGPLRMMSIDVPGEGSRRFLYLTYLVTNNSGQDLLLAPAWDLATTDGAVHRSGRGVTGKTWATILNQLNNPLLSDQIDILGLLLQGRDNAREGLVVWPADDLDLEDFRIYAAGFSGEFHRMTVRDPKTGSDVEVVLRKTLMARYAIPGDVYDRGADEIARGRQLWIMR